MAERSRFLEQDEAEALKRQAEVLRPFWRVFGRPVDVHFASATGAMRQVAHGLGVAPDGFLIVRATGAVYAVTPEKWTSDVARLTAPVQDTRATLIFFTLREAPIDV